MLGANYLIMKTNGEIQARSMLHSFGAASATLVISLAIYVWTIVRHPYMARKWLAMPELVHVAVFPILALVAFGIYTGKPSDAVGASTVHLERDHGRLFLHRDLHRLLSLHHPEHGDRPKRRGLLAKTLIFMLAVIIILLPLILAYIGFKNRLFRGKVGDGGYGD